MFGPHASKDKRGGFVETLEKLHKRGCGCMQVFVGSTYGRMSEASEKRYMEEAPEVKKALKKLGMKMFVHAPYTLNFAKKAEDGDAYWIEALWTQLKICDAMGAEGVVLHMGKSLKLDLSEAKDVFHENLLQLIGKMKATKCGAMIFIETSAGQGTELYPTLESNLEPVVEFYARFTANQRKYIGLCVDTCHIFAAGYDLGTRVHVQRFWSDFEERIGIAHLGVIHMNNSLKGCGSRVDRHAPLEAGKIDFDALAEFAKLADKHGVPMIVETSAPERDVVVIKKWLDGKYTKEAVDREMRDAMFS